jgi:hypothetical protein
MKARRERDARFRFHGAKRGLFERVFDSHSRRVLGLHVVSRSASDVVAGFAVAMNLGLTVDDVVRSHHAFPTIGEGVRLPPSRRRRRWWHSLRALERLGSNARDDADRREASTSSDRSRSTSLCLFDHRTTSRGYETGTRAWPADAQVLGDKSPQDLSVTADANSVRCRLAPHSPTRSEERVWPRVALPTVRREACAPACAGATSSSGRGSRRMREPVPRG